MNAEETFSKKRVDKSNDNLTVTLDKIDAKQTDTGEPESKPRIVLTFRSEKSNAKSSNMKIVSSDEKTDEAPRRSNRTRGKWDWICDTDTSPKKNMSASAQMTSDNEESDGSPTTPKRSTRRRSKDCDNVLANAIARKEKSYETSRAPQRLSRRIKPTAKILANEELRIGVESQNNARLGIQTDKSSGGVRTRRSARPIPVEEKDNDTHETDNDVVENDVVEIGTTDDDSQSQNSVMKLKHLCELGLKAISPEDIEDSSNDNREDENVENDSEQNEPVEHNDDDDDDDGVDDDPNVISKLLETDEDSDDEFLCTIDVKKKKPRTRRSTRQTSTYDMNDSDESSQIAEEVHKSSRRSSKRSGRSSNVEEPLKGHRSKRRRHRSYSNYDGQSGEEVDDNSNPAGGDEGSEAACPVDETTIVATCFCETPSNVYPAPDELIEPVFCQAVETVDGVRAGCCHRAAPRRPARRAGPRAPFLLPCARHAAQLARHMCCPACGLFCTQGIFYQCSLRHLFHLECGLPYNDSKTTNPGCPHCGMYSYRWQPVNVDCVKVKVEMKCSNKRIYLPDQTEQCTPAYLSFSTQDTKADQGPIIPKDLLPSLPIDIKQLAQAPGKSPEELCEAILKGETVDQLLPKIVASSHINKRHASQAGGTCVHAAARTGNIGALYLLHYAGANMDATDDDMRTPLILTITTLLQKPGNKVKEEILKDSATKESDKMEEDVTEDSTLPTVKTEEKDKDIEEDIDSEAKDIDSEAKEENLYKVIRYLLAAGCDINFVGPDGMTALHVAGELGGGRVARLLLAHAGVQPDLRDEGGWTPLVWAAENDHADIVKQLLEAGADPLAADAKGSTAAHWCAYKGAARALHVLLRAAPHAAHAYDAHSETPLNVAKLYDNYDCVVLLLASGARTDTENVDSILPVEGSTGECYRLLSLNTQMSVAVRDKMTRYKQLSSDISNGREQFWISCVNEVDDATLPDDFTYVTRHVTPQPVHVDTTIDTMRGCDCKDGDCSSGDCSCCALSVRSWYTRGRLHPSFPYHDPPMLFECNQTCGCNLNRCNNSVVTRATAGGSLCVHVQVFRAGGARGWALRTGQRVARGAPVALYCGELLPLARADTRPADNYMFALDVKHDLLEQCEEQTPLCVDTAQFGNAARFINHSCAPSLAPLRVFTHGRDLRLPTIVFFALRDLQPQDELTFDYGDKFWSVKSKWMNCECGSPNCRYPVKSGGNVTS